LNKKGQKGELLAEQYLIKKGYDIIAKNWRGNKAVKAPEIDIIAQKDNTIIFVEVKSCRTDLFGNPEYWITPAKQKRLITGARAYLMINPNESVNYRFDAIAVDCRTEPAIMNHVENAFTVAYDCDD